MALRSTSRALPLRPAGAVRRRTAAALAALILAAPARGLDRGPTADFYWSEDGATLAVVERHEARFVALRLFDGASGELRGTLASDRLALASGEAVEAQIAPAARHAVIAFGSRRVLWTVATDEMVELAAPVGAASVARLSPDGARLAYLDEGDLWSLDLASLRATRLASSVASEPGFAWSPDGLALAFATRDDAGGLALSVVDAAFDPLPRALETEELGAPIDFRWRPDGGAVGVFLRSADGARLELALCHPERSYCRPLAHRDWRRERVDLALFRFLADGFLWGESTDASGSLARYDTLGRERRRYLADAGYRPRAITALFESTHEVVVATESAVERGLDHLLLVTLVTGSAREIAAAAGPLSVAISETLRTWVRPRKGPDGGFVGYVLERIDGSEILELSLAGAPVTR